MHASDSLTPNELRLPDNPLVAKYDFLFKKTETGKDQKK